MNFILFVILIILLVAIGGERGVISLVALLGNILIFFISVYLMKYLDPYMLVIVDTIFMCLITLLYQNGVNIKTITALVSVLIVASILMIMSVKIGRLGNMGGYNEFEMYEDTLMYLSVKIGINIPDVAISMLVLGVVGALIDISVAATSSIHEVWINNEECDISEHIKTSLMLGKSIFGSTINTLWFACAGEFLLMFMLFRKYHYTFVKLINSKAFFDIIANILLSAIGCAMIVPVTIWVYTIVRKYYKPKENLAE